MRGRAWSFSGSDKSPAQSRHRSIEDSRKIRGLAGATPSRLTPFRQLLGDDDAVRRWFGAGMLDNVAVVLGLADIDEPWAHILTAR